MTCFFLILMFKKLAGEKNIKEIKVRLTRMLSRGRFLRSINIQRERSLRDIFARLNAFEKEVVALKAFRAAVEVASPNVAAAAQQLAEEKLNSLDNTVVDLENPLTPEEFEELYQFHALQQSKPISMTRLLHIHNHTDLLNLAQDLRREVLVRTANCAQLLNHAPLGLGRMPSIQRLRKWYEWSYHDAASLRIEVADDLATFDIIIRRLFAQHCEVRSLLFRGMVELNHRDMLTEQLALDPAAPAQLNAFFDSFCRIRVRLRFLVGDFVALTTHHLGSSVVPETVCGEDKRFLLRDTSITFYDHNPDDFRGLICRSTSLVKVVQHAIAEVKENFAEDEVPPIEVKVAGDPDMTFLGIPRNLVEIVASLIEAPVQANLLRMDRTGAPLTPIEVTISQHPDNNDLSLRVSDTAGGIPLSEVDRSMTYVYCSRSATKRDIQLPYTAVAAKAMGGEISVASIEGLGTDRTLYIPNTEGAKLLSF